MTAPAVEQVPAGRLVVRCGRAVDPAARLYPLATRAGIELLAAMIEAERHWRPLTRTQRAALRRGYRTALAAAAGAPDGTELPLPTLPDGLHPQTRRSLERRGLAAGGRLTPLAVEVVQLADDDSRPIETVTTTGGVL